MKYETEVKVIGSVATLTFCLLAYLIMAGLACFASWTNEYWNLANWDEVMRSLLFLIWAFLIGRGIWVAVVMIKDPKQ